MALFLIFRIIVSLITLPIFVFGCIEVANGRLMSSVLGPIFGVFALISGLAGVPSLAISIGIIRRKPWTKAAAVVHDVFMIGIWIAIAVTVTYGNVADRFGDSSILDSGMVLQGILLAPFLVEGLLASKHLRYRKLSLSILSLGFLAFVTIGIAYPTLISRRQISALSPLISYSEAHWAPIPKGRPIRYMMEPGADAAANVEADLGNGISLHFILSPNGPGEWRLKAGDPSTQNWALRVARGGASVIETEKDARNILAQAGVSDPQLSLKKVFRSSPFSSISWCYDSPKAGGVWVAGKDTRCAYLYLRKDVILPHGK